jgi:uncharacterized protein YjbI with pentapeptide repeats
MLTKNLTPFLFASKVTSLRPPAPVMTMIVRGTFRLRPDRSGEPVEPIEGLMEQGPLSGDLFAAGDDDRVGACLYATDFADFKLNAEVLLAGSCHAPGGRPVLECPVRFSVGPWSKTLVAVGPRTWGQRILGASISEPEPFVTMPLTYENGFGGPTYAPNPVGKGCDTPELPTVELPAARLRGRGDRPEPASFGPLNPGWPQRAGKIGQDYGARWRKERAPFFSEDFDWTYFNAAPVDQQLQGYLQGDEEVSFVNLHPEVPHFSARLPGLRVRAFARDAEGTVREARMNLDTLIAKMDDEQLVLVWRGLTPVQEQDLTDVKFVLVASENLADPPLPEEHYRELLDAFAADPVEFERHAPGVRQTFAALDAAMKDDAAHPERTPAERMEALGKHEDAFVGTAPAENQVEMRRAFAAAREKLAATPGANAALAVPEATPDASPTDGSPDTAEIVAAAIARVHEAVKALRDEGRTSEAEQLERLLEDPQTKQRLAAAAPVRRRELFPGSNLAGRNLSRLNLEGVDLAGANLEGANLVGARLTGARLAGANLRTAMLDDANLEGADLSDADLSQATLSRAHAAGVDLSRATLDMTGFDTADLKGATLRGARGKMTLLGRADLTGAQLGGVDFWKAIADDAVLAQADLTQAKLVECSFAGVKAEGLDLTGARLTTTTFAKADLRGARCVRIDGAATNWSGAVLEQADFGLAVLPRAHFAEVQATGARFFGADLRDTDFYRAVLDRADFERANLFGANLGKTTLNGTRFVETNLYESRFIGAGGKDCTFEGANVKRAMLPT